MRFRTILMIAALAATPALATAQTYPVASFHPSALSLPEGASLEEVVELDGNPATQEFVVANYAMWPTRRAVLQLGPNRTTCVGAWSYWFGDDPHIWPTYVTIDGLTRVFWQSRETGVWNFIGLELPGCEYPPRR